MADLIDNFVIKLTHVLYASIRDFTKNRCMYWATALSFFSITTTIPFLAVLIGAANYFNMIDLLERFLLTNFAVHHDVIVSLINTAQEFLKTINNGVMTMTGLIFIILILFQMLLLLEYNFNEIWQIKKERSWYRKIISYPLAIFIGPVIFMMFISIGIGVLAEFQNLIIANPIFSPILPLINGISLLSLVIIKIIPHLVLWLLLFVLYTFLPNTKVKILPALIGSFIATICFLGIQIIYIYLQINLIKYNTIYGSFAAIPFLLISIQWSWTIILYGSQLTYSIQESIIEEYKSKIPISNDQSSLTLRLRSVTATPGKQKPRSAI
jgi:membrane protein